MAGLMQVEVTKMPEVATHALVTMQLPCSLLDEQVCVLKKVARMPHQPVLGPHLSEEAFQKHWEYYQGEEQLTQLESMFSAVT